MVFSKFGNVFFSCIHIHISVHWVELKRFFSDQLSYSGSRECQVVLKICGFTCLGINITSNCVDSTNLCYSTPKVAKEFDQC